MNWFYLFLAGLLGLIAIGMFVLDEIRRTDHLILPDNPEPSPWPLLVAIICLFLAASLAAEGISPTP